MMIKRRFLGCMLSLLCVYCTTHAYGFDEMTDATGIFSDESIAPVTRNKPAISSSKQHSSSKTIYNKNKMIPPSRNMVILTRNDVLNLFHLLGQAHSGNIQAQQKLVATRAHNAFIFNNIEHVANSGNANAENLAGFLYQYGNLDYGIPQSDRRAVEYYMRAARKGSSKAQYTLGLLYETGTCVMQNDFIAIGWYQKAAEHGDINAQIALGLMYEKGHGTIKDVKKTQFWYQKAAMQGNPTAEYLLGLLYMLSDYGMQDRDKASYWLERATSQGSIQAQTALGILYLTGPNSRMDRERAAFLIRRSANKGDKTAIKILQDRGGELLR